MPRMTGRGRGRDGRGRQASEPASQPARLLRQLRRINEADETDVVLLTSSALELEPELVIETLEDAKD